MSISSPSKETERKIKPDVQELEERIAPSVHGTGGYDGQPGDLAASHGNLSGSASPEGSANPEH